MILRGEHSRLTPMVGGIRVFEYRWRLRRLHGNVPFLTTLVRNNSKNDET